MIPSQQAIQIVAVRSVGAKLLLIKKPLDATSEAYLVSALPGANRPAHLAVPATAQHHDCRPRNARSKQAKGPPPGFCLLVNVRHNKDFPYKNIPDGCKELQTL